MRLRPMLVGSTALLLVPSVSTEDATAQAKTNCEARVVYADGTFETTPKEGDCLIRPLTQADGIVRWTLK